MAKNSKIPGWPEMLQPPFANLAAGFGQSAMGAAPPGLAGGMDFMKGLWGGLPSSVPGFVLPTLDIGELDKRIEDLRSVESWLALNANMLKATIQGLEVQRNTLAALQALRDKGDLLSAMMMKPAGDYAAAAVHSKTEPDGYQAATPAASAEQAKSRTAFADAFRHSFGSGAGNPNWPLPLDASQAPAPVEPEEEQAPPVAEPPKVKKSARKKAHKGRARQAGNQAAVAGISSSAAQSANLWMNFLKDQFGQIANAALVAKAPVGAATLSEPKARLVTKAAARAPAKRPAKVASARPPGRTRTATKAAARPPGSGAKG